MTTVDERRERIEAARRLYRAGEPAAAAHALEQCLSAFSKEEHSTIEWADFCNIYGSALAESGNLKNAEALFSSAWLVYAANHRHLQAAEVKFNLGNVYRYMNSWQRAVESYQTALSGYRAAKDEPGATASDEVACLSNLIQVFLQLGAVEEARRHLAEIEKDYPAVLDDPEIAWSVCFQRAKLALHDGDAELALRSLESALSHAQALGNAARIEDTEAELAALHVRQGRSETAIPVLERVYAAARGRPDRRALLRGLALAGALATTGALDRSATIYAECVDLIDRGRSELDGAERFHWMENFANICHEYSEILFRLGRYDAAFAASERGQGRSLLDLMFRHQIKLQGGRRVRAAGAGRVALDGPDLPELLAYLRETGTHLVKLLQTPHGMLAWLVGPDGVIDAWRVDAADGALQAMFAALHPDDDTAADDQAKVVVRAHRPGQRIEWARFLGMLAGLYAALFSDRARAHLEATAAGRLIIVPHSELFSIPWAALGPAEGSPLSERWELAVVPSLGVFMQLDRRRDPRPWRGLSDYQFPVMALGACGEQTFDVPLLPFADARRRTMTFCDLPGTHEEITRVAESLHGAMLLGSQAHVAGLRAVMPLAGVLHLATHGFWNIVTGELSFVVLAPSPAKAPGTVFGTGEMPALFAHQLMRDDFRTHAELVVLSGCQSGLGTAHPDTYLNLAHAFLVAGARCVLVSLWPIRDDATVALMEAFYGELAQGCSPAAALQRTQAAMRTSLLWSDGWDWCGFVLVGAPFDGFAPAPSEPRRPGPAFCGGDVLCSDVAPGDLLPLESFQDERQTPSETWLLRGGKIHKLHKQ